MQAFTSLAFIFSLCAPNHAYKAITEPDCTAISSHSICNTQTHEFCKWNDRVNLCDRNYDEIYPLFMDYKSLISPSVLFWSVIFCVSSFVLIEHVISYFVQRSGFFVHLQLDAKRKSKVVIYIFEIILTTISLIVMTMDNTVSIIWDPKSFESLTPSAAKVHFRNLLLTASMTVIGYSMEMAFERSEMRASLKIHHTCCMTLVFLWCLAANDRPDIDGARVGVILQSYIFLEQNVFMQLILYRINGSKYLGYHIFSTAFYVVSKLAAVVMFYIAYVDWAMSDFVQNELFQNSSKYGGYIVFFLFIPLLNALLNYAQFVSFTALRMMTRSVAKNRHIMQQLQKDDRIRLLYDRFLQFDSDNDRKLDISDWQNIITHYFIFVDEYCMKLMWQMLGFAPHAQMSWHEFHGIFGDSVKQATDFATDDVIKAKLTVLVSEVMEEKQHDGQFEKHLRRLSKQTEQRVKKEGKKRQKRRRTLEFLVNAKIARESTAVSNQKDEEDENETDSDLEYGSTEMKNLRRSYGPRTAAKEEENMN